MTRLSHDYEWASSTPIDQGLDRYFAAGDSRPLLYAYRFDAGPIKLWDARDGVNFPREVDEALLDPHVEKWGFNNTFERQATQRRLGVKVSPVGWRCTLALAYSQSFIGGLGDVGAQMGLTPDKAKDARGKKLIRLFCMPQRITTNQPHLWRDWRTDPAEWEEFRQYCVQDVVAEEAIRDALLRFPMAESEWRLYELDQRINDAGLPIDTLFVENALRLADDRKKVLRDEMRAQTGLENPGSGAQLLPWLKERGYPFDDLQKETVERAASTCARNPETLAVLDLHSKSAKSSTAKYATVRDAVGADGRLRGCFQFLGASRTGRWAGRSFQPQNLPRTPKFLEPAVWMDATVEAIRAGDLGLLELLVGEPMDALTGAMRATIRAKPGHELRVCDLNAIESRVIGWLAGSEPLLDVFHQGRDPYKVFAQGMFNVGYDQVTRTQRNTAKAPVLGCLGSNTMVLTPRGQVRIVNLQLSDLIHDGFGWVSHQGVIDQGIKPVMTLAGIQITPDHEVLTPSGWRAAWDVRRNSRSVKQAINLAVGLLSGSSVENPTGTPITFAAVKAAGAKKKCTGTTWRTGKQKPVLAVPTLKSTSATEPSILCFPRTVATSSTGLPIGSMRLNPGVAASGRTASTMGCAASAANSQTSTISSGTASHLTVSRTPKTSTSTGSTTTATTRAVISGLLPSARTPETSGASTTSNMAALSGAPRIFGANLRRSIAHLRRLLGKFAKGFRLSKSSTTNGFARANTYDVFRAGPHQRFVVITNAGPLLVHNCGFGLGAGEPRPDGTFTGLMGYAAAMRVPMTQDEAKHAVKVFRSIYPEVPALWRALAEGAEACLETRKPQQVGPFLRFERTEDYLRLVLPSGRSIFYHKPEMVEVWFAKHPRTKATKVLGADPARAKRAENKGWEIYSRLNLAYMGKQQNGSKWVRIITHAGKVTENAVQAVARDVLAVGMRRADRDGFSIVGTVHDEIITEQPLDDEVHTVERLAEHMTKPIKWAHGLPLGAAGWSGLYYQK